MANKFPRGGSEQVMIVLCWLKKPQTFPKIAAIEQLLQLISKKFATISSQPKLNQT
jgi:hypothetical protein